MMNTRRRFAVVLLAFFMSMSVSLWAQPDGEEEDEVLDVPFDGGISLLVAAGVGYGAKKVYDSKKRKNDSNEPLL